MLNSDRKWGKVILIVTCVLFFYYTIWVIGLPFIDDNRIRSYFGSQTVALMAPAVIGLCFIGGLILFTIYNVEPHLLHGKLNKFHES